MEQQFYYKKNRLQQVKGFCYTVQEGSMIQAAEKMGLTPSAITLQIQSLERDLGVELFEKDRKKIKLTSNGKIFYARAIAYVQGMDDLFKDFSAFIKNKKSSVISIGGNVSICYLLPKYIEKFEKLYPKVEFEIRNITKQDAIKRLINDEIDIAIYSMTEKLLPSELNFYPMASYKAILLTNKHHPLAKKDKVRMADIRKYKLLRLDPQFVTADNFDEVVRHHKLETKVEFEMGNYEILKRFVKAGVGISIISGICLEGEADKGLIEYDLSNYFNDLTYGIMIKKGKVPSSLLQKFIDTLLEARLLKQCR